VSDSARLEALEKSAPIQSIDSVGCPRLKERQLAVSLLHAAPTFFPVYEALGYFCSQSKWAAVALSLLETENYFAASNFDGWRILNFSTAQKCNLSTRF
jgi:hypothetical protein